MKKAFSDIIERIKEEERKKVWKKIPDWSVLEDIRIPAKINLEQCSSAAAARFKADIAASLTGGSGVISDLTGGLGVDSWALSRVCDTLHYYERDSALLEAARENLSRLGCSNIVFHNEQTGPGSSFEKSALIYADPARRDSSGKKVFLLEDCSPDILTMIPALLEKAPQLLFKLSPMADITMLTERFEGRMSRLWVVSFGGEVKELLCLLERGFNGECSISVVENARTAFEFLPSQEREAVCEYAAGLEVGDHLAEPGAGLLKSGAFKLVCARFGLEKIDRSTQLYRSANPVDSPMFKSRRIIEILPMCGESIRSIGRRYPQAEVTARNLPVSSEALKKKMLVRSGGDKHIYAFSSLHQGRLIAVTVPEDA